jgi:dipeptidyl aminopeptidase/acylaminoacyl peptidase
VQQSGGAAELITKPDANVAGHLFPRFLPDGRHYLYSAGTTVYLGTLDGIASERLVEGVSPAQYAPPASRDSPGYLLYVREATLMAQGLDPSTFRLIGDAFPLAERINSTFGGSLQFFSVSETGLAYRTGATTGSLSLTWFDRDGKSLGSIGRPGTYTDVAISRSGNQVAAAFLDARSPAADIWLLDARRGVSAPLTSTPGVDATPVWSPDDQRLAFSSDRGETYGALNGFLQPLNGAATAEQVLKRGTIRDWSRDGRYLLYDDRDDRGAYRLSILPLEGDRKLIAYPHDRFNEAQGQFAPAPGSGPPKWIAYTSNASGDNEIWVHAFPPSGRPIQISNGGGIEPRWRHDGRELFYLSLDRGLMAVDVTLEPQFSVGQARELFKTRIVSGGSRAYSYHYDVAPDGKRFLIITRPEEGSAASPPITIVLNWQMALKK